MPVAHGPVEAALRDESGGSKKTDLDKLKQQIRESAKTAGFGLCGFTKVDRRFIEGAKDNKFPYDTVIVLGMEMDYGLLEKASFPGKRL